MKTATSTQSARILLICISCSAALLGCGGGSFGGETQTALLAETTVCYTAWAGARHTYVGGDTVSINNQNYTAIYWTQSNPLFSNGLAGSGQPWSRNGTCDNTRAA
jgi:hypothetical protein